MTSYKMLFKYRLVVMGGDKNKKITHLNSIRGTQRFTKPSQTNDNANVQINTEKAMPKLKKTCSRLYWRN